MDAHFFVLLLGIIWVDLLLSGDNAVVIALVCRGLPANQQKIGLVFGSVTAIVLRIAMAFVVSFLLQVEGLRIAGGLLLLYIAAKLVWDEAAGDDDHVPATTLLKAVVAIGLADAGMSLDNVMAVAALAHGNLLLMTFGIVLAIPFVIAGAAIVKASVDRFPIIVWFGAALLGWVAGSIFAEDPVFHDALTHHAILISAVSAAAVVAVGLCQRWRSQRPAAA